MLHSYTRAQDDFSEGQLAGIFFFRRLGLQFTLSTEGPRRKISEENGLLAPEVAEVLRHRGH